MKRVVGALVVAAATLGFSQPAHAEFTVLLQSAGSGDVTVVDGGGGDASAGTENVISFVTTYAGYFINVQSTSNQVTGSTTDPEVPEISTTTVSVRWADPLVAPTADLFISVSDDGWLVPDDGTLSLNQSLTATWSNLSGSLTQAAGNGSTNMLSYADDGNTLFVNGSGATPTISGSSPFLATSTTAPSPLIPTSSLNFTKTGTYSFTHVIGINLLSGRISGNIGAKTVIASVPEPGSLLLFGAGLLGFVTVARHRGRRARP